MSGILFNLGAGAIDDPDGLFPGIYPDALMSDGTLLLLDGGHSLGGLTATPADAIPNIAWETAAAMIGSGDAASLAATFEQGGLGAGMGKEITAKGGLNIAARQDGTVTNGQGYRVELPLGVRDYILANVNNDFYVSIWMDTTRSGVDPLTGVGYPIVVMADTTSSTGNFVGLLVSQAQGGSYILGHRESAGYNAAGIQLRNIANSQSTGTVDDLRPEFVSWGAIGAWAGALAGAPTDLPSYVLYRVMIEDLTVSGRTYAEVDALDLAAHQAAFGAGGKFIGDTPTPAATLAGA